MALKSKLRSFRRFIPLASALLLAALVAIPSSGIALAQTPPGDEITLVNADRDFVERKGGGEFVARPVFDRKIVVLHYAVRDADTGDWVERPRPYAALLSEARRETRPRPALRLALDRPQGPGRTPGSLGSEGVPAGQPPGGLRPDDPPSRRGRCWPAGTAPPAPSPGSGGASRPWSRRTPSTGATCRAAGAGSCSGTSSTPQPSTPSSRPWRGRRASWAGR